jgi:hypothetical protein
MNTMDDEPTPDDERKAEAAAKTLAEARAISDRSSALKARGGRRPPKPISVGFRRGRR